MHDWLKGNKRGLAIVRVSSRRQEGNISHETQEAEIQDYCRRNGIKLTQIVRLIESAKDSEDRKKYAQALSFALANDIRHICFYMYDRESRNLTDHERNEKLVKSGIICLHYVRDNKVLHEGSADSDFLTRDMAAIVNKQFIRTHTAKVVDAMRKKAEGGWYPSNKPPLGYAVQKVRDEQGREMKRGGIIVRDPDERMVRLVTREFELRADGMSYEEIRKQVIAEKLVSASRLAGYHKSSIELRIHNPFYEGRFIWQGKEYQGKHELIIPPALVARAKDARRRSKAVSRLGGEHGLFGGGWLHCALCGCHVVYDPKSKRDRGGALRRVFHYYHCSNGKRVHPSFAGMNIPEHELWAQFDQAIDAIHLPEKLAKRIADALNADHKASAASGRKRLDEIRAKLTTVDEREMRALDHLDSGVLDAQAFKLQMTRIREERARLNRELSAVQTEIQGQYRETADSILELCKQAKRLYLSRSPLERRDFLEKVLSNPRLRERTIEYDLKKPILSLVEMKADGEWRTRLDDFRTSCALLHGENTPWKHTP